MQRSMQKADRLCGVFSAGASGLKSWMTMYAPRCCMCLQGSYTLTSWPSVGQCTSRALRQASQLKGKALVDGWLRVSSCTDAAIIRVHNPGLNAAREHEEPCQASAHARALLDEGLGCVCQGVGARACARVLAYFPRSKLGALRQALLAAASSEIVI
eukprot:1142852-Pelagomonas_calceolata.AAC.2